MWLPSLTITIPRVMATLAAVAVRDPIAGSIQPSPAAWADFSGRQSSEQVLHNFGGSDGLLPDASLIVGHDGTLYGTAENGGSDACLFGCGTVFELKRSGTGFSFNVLYTFQYDGDGAVPAASLLQGKGGVLFGTTFVTNQSGDPNAGTVFELQPQGSGYSERVLYAFSGGSDGASPESALTSDTAGGLYGTTVEGGAFAHGTVFKLTPDGSQYAQSVLYSFRGNRDGAAPRAAVVMAKNGKLFGTTSEGGLGHGTVFELTPKQSTYVETRLYSFAGGADGADPIAGLLMDAAGTLYGVTRLGGSSSCRAGCGTVFSLTPTASGYAETVLYRFRGHRDGAQPVGGLIGDGNVLYGTTRQDGDHSCGGECGVVFKLTRGSSGYTEEVLHRFTGSPSDGADVGDGLVADAHGVLYGTTFGGGSNTSCYWSETNGCGTVFKLQP